MRAIVLALLLGLIAAVSYPLVVRQATIDGEAAARRWLLDVGSAQARFHAANGGYAATLQSLVEPCGNRAPELAATLVGGAVLDAGYEIALRPAQGAIDGPADCHGRLTVTDYYVSARPVTSGAAGTEALAMTSAARVFTFVDGVPPTEADMMPGGLAADEGRR